MPAIAMALIWGGYTLTFWGWANIRGYKITLGEIVIPGRFNVKRWPPPSYADDNAPPEQEGGSGVSTKGPTGSGGATPV